MFCRVLAVEKGERAMGDEVAGQQNHVRGKVVDVVDDAFEEKGLSELVEMDIADLRDAEAIESTGEVGDSNSAGDEIDLMSGDFAGIKGQTCCRSARTNDEVATAEA